MSIRFAVMGAEPAPQGSKRSVGHNRFVEASKKLMPYREAIISQIIRDNYHTTALNVPVAVRATFFFQRPRSHYRTGKNSHLLKDGYSMYKTSTPDLDKLQRALGDALAQSGLLADDNLIVQWDTRKMWGDRHATIVEVITL